MGCFSRHRFGRLADPSVQSFRGLRPGSRAKTELQKDRSFEGSEKMREISPAQNERKVYAIPCGMRITGKKYA
jgi:hypothetical protein